MPRRISLLMMVLIASISVPASAYANAGTPLMWVSALHLVFGNFLLGILEGALLVWWFRSRPSVALSSMIAANYFSAWLGGYILFWQLGYVGEITLLNFWFWFWSFWIAAFVLTCGIEFPFFVIALWKRGKGVPVWRAIAACLLVHSVSYLILSWLYFGASNLTIATKFTVVPVREICLENQYTLFYITPDGRHVVESTLLGSSPRPVFSIPPEWNPDRLVARPNENGRYDLCLVVEGEKTRSEIIRKDFACQAPLDYLVGLGGEYDDLGKSVLRHGPVPALEEPSFWDYRVGFWAFEGIYAQHRVTGKVESWGLELPMVQWLIRNAVQIDGDRLVFQLGRDQICLLDPETRRIALIARGFGPLVAVKCHSD